MSAPLRSAGIGTDPRPWSFVAASTTPGLVEERPPMDYPGTGQRRAAEALRSAAATLSTKSVGAARLREMAHVVEQGRRSVGEARAACNAARQDVTWTHDERAAFALAREALSTLDAAKETP